MFSDAVDEITNADIPHATRTNALRLLRHAHPDNGHVAITWQDASTLCEVSLGTLRRQLGQMAAAHLIHYSSNGDGYVYCTFKAWIRREPSKNSTVDARGRAGTVEKFDSSDESDQGQARVDAREPSKNSTVDARGRAVDARSLTRASAPDLTDRLTDQIDPTNISQSVTAPPIEERRRTEALLAAIRVDRKDASRIALAHHFVDVRDAVAGWWMNRKSRGGKLENSPGIVLYWLKEGKSPNTYDDEAWHKEELYRSHRTPQEVAAADSGVTDDEAERRRKYVPDEFSNIAIG